MMRVFLGSAPGMVWQRRHMVIYCGRYPRPSAARLFLPMTDTTSGSTGISTLLHRPTTPTNNGASVAKGDQKAFAELYRSTSSRVYGVIVRMMPDHGEAEDIPRRSTRRPGAAPTHSIDQATRVSMLRTFAGASRASAKLGIR